MRRPCGHRTGATQESSMFFISYGTRIGPCVTLQGCRTAPLRTRKGIDTTIIGKNPTRASYLALRGPYGPLRSPHGLFTGCLPYLKPYGFRKLIIHALKLYGSCAGRQNSYGAARGPCGEWTYDKHKPGSVFCLWINKVSANEKKYIYQTLEFQIKKNHNIMVKETI